MQGKTIKIPYRVSWASYVMLGCLLLDDVSTAKIRPIQRRWWMNEWLNGDRPTNDQETAHTHAHARTHTHTHTHTHIYIYFLHYIRCDEACLKLPSQNWIVVKFKKVCTKPHGVIFQITASYYSLTEHLQLQKRLPYSLTYSKNLPEMPMFPQTVNQSQIPHPIFLIFILILSTYPRSEYSIWLLLLRSCNQNYISDFLSHVSPVISHSSFIFNLKMLSVCCFHL